MLRGRIGVAKRVHWIAEMKLESMWGVSLCGKWAGRLEVVKDTHVTCGECFRLGGEGKRWMEGTPAKL